MQWNCIIIFKIWNKLEDINNVDLKEENAKAV